MTDLTKAARMALEALEKERQMAAGRRDFSELSVRAINELDAALESRIDDEQPAQQELDEARKEAALWQSAYDTAMGVREPLSDEQIVWLVPGLLDCLCDPYDCDKSGNQYASIPKDMVRLARAIEQHHGITSGTATLGEKE